MRSLIAIVSVLVLAAPNSASGQAVTGDIEGWVVAQETGDAVPYVSISVSGKSLQTTRGSMSMSDGYFSIKALPVGVYSVKIQHISYKLVSYDDVSVRLGKTTTLGKTELIVATIEMEEIVVSGRRPLLDFSTTESGNNLSSEVLDQLPTPRDYREVLTILPHANASFLGDNTNVSGATGSENQYFIEGVNVTDPFLAGSGMRLPQNFVREVQVKKGGYEAEFGKATGGIINVITHSGSNEFNGQVFGFLTNNNVASDSRRGLGNFEQQDFDRYDFGTSLGGAIVSDKLWYFVAYNPTFENESLEIPGLSFHDDKAVSHLFAGKLTWSADPSTSLDLTVFGDPTHRDKVGGGFLIPPQETQLNADPLLVDQTTGAITASLSGRRLFGERAIVEASVSRLEANNEERPATERGRADVTYIDLYNSELSGGMQINFDHHTERWATDVSTTVFAGSHEFKLGAAYEDIALDEEWIVQTPDGRHGEVYRDAVDQWHSLNLLNEFEVSHRTPSVFAQDSWRVTDRLRVNAGLRWDGMYIVNPKGDVVQSINDGYQPRAGFTYQLDERGSQKVSGSYGRFYEQIPMIASSWFFGEFYQEFAYYDQNPLPDFTVTPTRRIVLEDATMGSDDLEGQYLDEFTLGYERRVGTAWKTGVRGIYRDVGEVIEDAFALDGRFWLGNPGQGTLDHLPDPVRRYMALEFSLENTFGRNLHLASSYVLSETRGNYPGMYNTDMGNPHANVSNQFLDLAQISEGLLPNDRTHVFKMYGSYAFDFGLTTGGFFSWQSGTPLSEYGATVFGVPAHLIQRGTAGRSPSIWDANLRIAYDLSRLSGGPGGTRTRLLFDVFHLFGQKEVVHIEQGRYLALDAQGNQTAPNPNFGKGLAYQSPMTIRFGIETSF